MVRGRSGDRVVERLAFIIIKLIIIRFKEWIIILSFITGGEDGYVRLCFFDAEYFTKDEMEEKELRQLELLAEKKA